MKTTQDSSGADGSNSPDSARDDRFQIMFERASEGILLTTFDGKIIDCNPSFAKLRGYARNELKSMSIQQLHTPESAHLIPDRLRRIVAEGSLSYEIEHIHKDGHLIPIEASASVIIANGEPMIQSFSRDITERKLAERMLRESEERNRVLIQQAPEAIFVFDVDANRIVDGNRKAELLFQLSHEQLLRRSPLDFLQKLDPDPTPISQSFHEHNSQILNGEQLTFERMVRGAQGREALCEIRLTKFPSGDRKLIRASIIDITSRVQAERIIEDSDYRFEQLMENMSEGYTVIDVEMRYAYLNKSAAAHARNEPGQLIGKKLTEVYSAADNRELFTILDQVMASRVAQYLETCFTFLDGSTAWFELRIAPVTEGISVLSVDNTQRKLIELELEQKRSAVTYLSRLAVLGELSGAIAHELNQPLMSILMNAESAKLLLTRGEKGLDEVDEILTEIIDEDVRASGIIQRLRKLFAQEEVMKQKVDINELIMDVGKILKNELINRGITLQLRLGDGLGPVNIDRIQVEQVMINLIVNACDALDGSDRDKTVMCRTSEGPGGVKVSVVDTGSGIPAEQLSKIFDPFFTTKKQGMGLGLSICRTIINAHSGLIWAENNGDRGSSVHFTLPAGLRE